MQSPVVLYFYFSDIFPLADADAQWKSEEWKNFQYIQDVYVGLNANRNPKE